MGPRLRGSLSVFLYIFLHVNTCHLPPMSSLYEPSKIQKLNETNFVPWRLIAQAVLEEKGLWSAIVGIVADAVKDGSPTEAQTALDHKAKRSLLLLVDNRFLKVIDKAATAKGAWEALQQYFVQKYQPSKVYLENDFNTLTIKHGESISAFYKRIDEHVDLLDLAGVEVSDARVVDTLLRGISDVERFSHVVDTMIGDASLSIVSVLERLQKVEARVGSSSGSKDAGIVKANAALSGKKGCFKCGALDHWKEDCPKRKGKKKGGSSSSGSEGECDFCGRSGHNADNCKDRAAFQRLLDRRLIPLGTGGGMNGSFAGVATVVLPGEPGYEESVVQDVTARLNNGHGYETQPY